MRAVIDYAKHNDLTLLVWCRYKASASAFLTRSDAMLATDFLADQKPGVRFVVGNYQSMGTGVDGLQHLIKDQIWLDLPRTYADWEQANRRLVRRGSPYQGRQRILVPDTTWNRKVMDVIEGRKTLDDIIKTEQLG